MTETKIAEKTEKPEKTQADATATAEAKEKTRLFNMTQIAGGALAAVTTAAVGSRLGVAGTLVGAALASVLAAFASTLYTKGLEHTRESVKKIVLRDGKLRTEVDVAATEARQRAAWRRPLAIVGGMALTSAATFVVAMGLVTGWEFGTGQTLDGRTGTTIGQVSNRQSTKPTPSATAKPTTTPSATPTDTPTATATPTPAPSATSTDTPAPTPSATQTEAPATPADSGQGALAG